MEPVHDDLARTLSNLSTRAAQKTEKTTTEEASGTDAQARDLEKGSQQEGSQNEASGGEEKDPFLVKFEDGDSQNPQSWSMKRKWCLVVFLSWITLLT